MSQTSDKRWEDKSFRERYFSSLGEGIFNTCLILAFAWIFVGPIVAFLFGQAWAFYIAIGCLILFMAG